MIGLVGLKNAIQFSLVMMVLRSSNAFFSSSPHLNFVSLCVSFLSGAVSDAYLGIHFDKFPIMPKKLLIASFDSDSLDSFTALNFSCLGLSPTFVNFYPLHSSSSTTNSHFSQLNVIPKS